MYLYDGGTANINAAITINRDTVKLTNEGMFSAPSYSHDQITRSLPREGVESSNNALAKWFLKAQKEKGGTTCVIPW